MRFSLVIPTYNGSQYIEECILSGLNQTRSFDEVIISDDNSSDDTLSICDKYKDRITIYRNGDGPSGFVNGWNNAIKKATGDYICILHQDDLLDSSYLEEAEKILSENQDIQHYFTTCHYIDEDGNKTGITYPDTGELRRYKGLEYMKEYQNAGNPHIHRCPGVMTHRSLFEIMQYNPAAGHIADDDFFYRVGQYTAVIGLLKPLASYRMHSQSETGKLHDYQLVGRLVSDYAYQTKQWKQNDFIDEEAYRFFVRSLHRYSKRLFAYALKRGDLKNIAKAIKSFFG